MARDWDGHEIPAGVVAVGRSCPKGFEGISGRASLKRVNVTRFINAEKTWSRSGTAVYRAVDSVTNTRVEVKTVDLGGLDMKERVQALRLVRMHASVDHVNIIPVWFAFIENNHLCIVTPECEGNLRTHAQAICNDSRSIAQKVTMPLLSALWHLHMHGLAHCTVTLDNVLLLGKNPRVVLTDFQSASLIKPDRVPEKRPRPPRWYKKSRPDSAPPLHMTQSLRQQSGTSASRPGTAASRHAPASTFPRPGTSSGLLASTQGPSVAACATRTRWNVNALLASSHSPTRSCAAQGLSGTRRELGASTEPGNGAGRYTCQRSEDPDKGGAVGWEDDVRCLGMLVWDLMRAVCTREGISDSPSTPENRSLSALMDDMDWMDPTAAEFIAACLNPSRSCPTVSELMDHPFVTQSTSVTSWIKALPGTPAGRHKAPPQRPYSAGFVPFIRSARTPAGIWGPEVEPFPVEGGAEEHGTCADMRGRTGSLESESTAQGRPLSCGTLSMGDAESLQALRSL